MMFETGDLLYTRAFVGCYAHIHDYTAKDEFVGSLGGNVCVMFLGSEIKHDGFGYIHILTQYGPCWAYVYQFSPIQLTM